MFGLFFGVGTTSSSDSSIIAPAEKQLNAFQKWWQAIDWEAIIAIIIQKALMLIFLMLLFLLIWRIVIAVIDRTYQSYGKRMNLNAGRMTTIHTLIRNIVQYTIGFFFLYSILSVLGVPVGSLLAGAGIAGVAIGLGAQGFMNDIITGFFIIMEQQIDVGDYIRLKNLDVEGTVTSVGLRTLQLKAVDGTVHFIPNRNITTISNTSRADMQVIVDVRINPSEGIADIRAIIEQANRRIEDSYKDSITTPPSVFGLVDIGNGNYAIRTTLYTKNGFQYKVKEELLSDSINSLLAEGFTIPNEPIITNK
ncbi:mechanosensitive ion channel family protein [Enterococcus italicus]